MACQSGFYTKRLNSRSLNEGRTGGAVSHRVVSMPASNDDVAARTQVGNAWQSTRVPFHCMLAAISNDARGFMRRMLLVSNAFSSAPSIIAAFS